jgi:hypothetical protein
MAENAWRDRVARWGAALLTWALTDRAKHDVSIMSDTDGPFTPREMAYFEKHLQLELDGLYNMAATQAIWQRGEAEILDARLARRFDPGVALNEAFNRAVTAKRALRDLYTDRQEAALKVQIDTLRRILRAA